jgi:phospholipid transport system substrate-binding protein
MTGGRLRLGLGTALVLTLPIAITVWAAPPPTDQLRKSIDQVLRVLKDPEMNSAPRAGQRRAVLRKIAGEIFDYAEITKRALGPHWQARTPAERVEIVRLFSHLLERSYIAKIELYNGERIAYTGESVDGEQAIVRIRIVTRQGNETPVEYRMLRRGDRWLTYDLTIEGVSLVSNYRGQFNKILQSGSHGELVKRLREAVEDRTEEGGPKVRRASQR